MKTKFKTIAFALALIMALVSLPLSGSASLIGQDGLYRDSEGYLESGLYSSAKLSKQQIRQLLSQTQFAMTDPIFTVEPSVTAPYAPGEVNHTLLENAAARLNAIRAIAGVGAVTLDDSLCENAQYGAVLIAASEFSHYPPQPDDMDDTFYQLGRSATSTSNIYAGLNFNATVDGFMNDSDASNVSRVGHRRWQINPGMGKVGFGYAINTAKPYSRFTVEKVFDSSASYGDFDFISWPSSGNFPCDTTGFNSSTAWNVTLNRQKFAVPSLADLTVTITREYDGVEYVLSGSETYQAAGSGAYLNVENSNYGLPLCIIFRPQDPGSYCGLYTVRIEGLKTKAGDAVDFAYQVDFFESAAVAEADLSCAYAAATDRIVLETGANYPFYPDTFEDRSVIVSGNAGVASSQSYLRAYVDLKAGETFECEYYYSTQPTNDVVTQSLFLNTQDQWSGESGGWLKFSFTAERDATYCFKWNYSKNYSVNGGLDRVMFDNMRIVSQTDGLAGDIDCSGIVDMSDVSILFQYLNGAEPAISEQGMINADVTGDGIISIIDVTALFGVIANS